MVEASHLLEHLDRPFLAMKEMHRILKPGGQLIIKVPHFSRGFTHAEHAHGFDVTFPNYFNKKFSGDIDFEQPKPIDCGKELNSLNIVIKNDSIFIYKYQYGTCSANSYYHLIPLDKFKFK